MMPTIQVQAEYELVGESAGPQRIRHAAAEVGMEGVVLLAAERLKPGKMLVVRCRFPGDEDSFVGVAVVGSCAKGRIAASWLLTDSDRTQLEAALGMAERDGKEAAA